jgi:hypothetical protein
MEITFRGTEGAVCSARDRALDIETRPDGRRVCMKPNPIDTAPGANCLASLVTTSNVPIEVLESYRYIHSNLCPALKVGP